MKTLESSARGRGGGGNYRGRGGRGRGGSSGGGSVAGGRGRGRDSGDRRFSARFTDPRFQVSTQAKRQPYRQSRDNAERAAQQDPRFARHFAPSHDDDEDEENAEEEEDEEEEGDDASSNEVEETGSLPSEEAADLDEEVNAWAADDVEFIEARRRVAIVNCDWDHVRAVDLYAILFHALPLGGQLSDVCVYMSDFGKKMIDHEKMHGPDLWTKPGEAEPAVDGATGDAAEVPEIVELPEDVSDDEVSEPRSDGWMDDNAEMMHEQGEDGELFSDGKFRRYEMDRMKYYYAVATFDSAETAAAVYNELDGMDIEASGVVLDLRYIDDEETFEHPVSRADHIPANFRPLASFKMSAMSQSKFRISWDQDDVFRHQSVQDSFTGTTEVDDIAAYLAPADSDDELDGNPATQEKRAREKLNIRRKYAALLEEVGGLPDEVEGGDSAEGASASDDDGSDEDGSDDDSLNRFSDVEMDENDDDDDEEGTDGDGEEVTGDMEATIDLDADSKAAGLQREARLKQKLKSATLATQAEVKYKLRRKEMKKSKKMMALEEREAGKAAQADHQAENRQKLRELIGTDDEGAVRSSGKERRKAHAKEVKVRLAEERVAKKKMRAANQLGVTQQVQHVRREQEAEKADSQIDDRFKSKLLSDPRFHLEVAQKDKRVADDVAQFASTVAKARQGKRGRVEDAKQAATQESMKDTVDFFLAKKKKTRK